MDKWISELEANIEECFADEERSKLDEGDEAVIVPSVAVMSVLCEHCQAEPPKPEVVARWEQAYLAIFDAQIEDLQPAAGYTTERRQVIAETFRKFKEQSATYWGGYEDALQKMTFTVVAGDGPLL
ncbi:MAG: hypothetical protein M3Y13_11840 [Armatimonadota bacterium]|nr:hypothetical protein [Armatimonadota bacterium]